MKFYFAAPFTYAQSLIPLVAHIHGTTKHSVTSSWLFIPEGTRSKHAMEAMDYAFKDLADVNAADILVLFNPPGVPQSPGRNIEFGYALAKGKQLMIVGERKGVFQYLPCVSRFDDITDFQHYLSCLSDELLAPYEG